MPSNANPAGAAAMEAPARASAKKDNAARAGVDLAAHAARIGRQDRIATAVLTAIVALVLALLGAIVAFILVQGLGKALSPGFLTTPPTAAENPGISSELFDSFYMLAITLLISVPISMGAAVFLVEYAPDNWMTAAAKTAIETLSSLPSIVVGLFGFLFFVLYMGWGFSIIAGAVALTMFNIPILVRVIQQALEDVPRSQRDAALAMGLTRWEATIHVLLPAAMPAIVTGVVLSAGRVFGEAAALIFTAGQSAPVLDFMCFDFSSPSCPWNVFRPAETLAVHIWKINSEGVVPDLEAVSNGTAAVLMVCILGFNVIARFVGKALEKRLTSE